MLLVVGILIAFLLSLTFGLAILSLTGDGERGARLREIGGRLSAAAAPFQRVHEAAAGVRARLARLGPRSLAVSIASRAA